MKAQAKILVVDDDRDMALLLQDFLSRQGYSVEMVLSGPQALRWFNSSSNTASAKLVLSDVKMGSMSGIDLTRELVQKNPELMIILYSAFGNKELENEAIRSGAVNFLHKPFPLARVASLVGEKLQARK